MDETKTPTCRKCNLVHYNFQSCRPRQDLKPAVQWGSYEKWSNIMGELKYNGGNTFLNRREGER